MKIVDLNILLYAVNRDGPHHARAKKWLDRALNADEPIGLAWVVLLGFLRVSTSPRVFPRPIAMTDALELVDGWLSSPAVVPVVPGPDHWRVLRGLLVNSGAAGNLTTDAHLAAMAIESGAELCSCDADFGRFANLNWINPLA